MSLLNNKVIFSVDVKTLLTPLNLDYLIVLLLFLDYQFLLTFLEYRFWGAATIRSNWDICCYKFQLNVCYSLFAIWRTPSIRELCSDAWRLLTSRQQRGLDEMRWDVWTLQYGAVRLGTIKSAFRGEIAILGLRPGAGNSDPARHDGSAY